MPASDPAYSALAETLASAVREAGALAVASLKAGVKHWTKGKDSPVSEADIAVDALLKARLATPGIAWLSEETDDDLARLDARRVWVVDPIDGTRAYIAGLPDWTISAALVEDGCPVIGVIFAPVDDEFFQAVVGTGATCNGVPMLASAGNTLAGARIAGPSKALDRLQSAVPAIVAVPRVHSLALRFARVAQGRLDGAFAGGDSHDWDLAAADLLIQEADGLLTTLAGQRIAYNRPNPVHGPLVAAGRSRHPVLSDILREPTT